MGKENRTMNRRLTTAVIAAASLALAGSIASAQGPGERGKGHGRGQGQDGQRIAKYLGLTDEQVATWKTLHEQQRTEMQPLWDEGRKLHEALKASLDAPKPDPTTVGKATLALKAHREKMKASHEAFEAKLVAILTPEQKTKWDAMKELRGMRGPQGPGFGGHHGPSGPGGPHPPLEG
jgi:Spy/CpxP family protein refolding chaperone